MAAFLWNLRTKEYLDAYMFPQNYMNIKDVVVNRLILTTDACPGVVGILRLVC